MHVLHVCSKDCPFAAAEKPLCMLRACSTHSHHCTPLQSSASSPLLALTVCHLLCCALLLCCAVCPGAVDMSASPLVEPTLGVKERLGNWTSADPSE